MEEVLNQLRAPFTLEQVVALNAYQRSGQFHPFTCPHQDNPRHPGGEIKLVATEQGFRCPHCTFSQNWTHDFMATPACEECGAFGEPLAITDDLRIVCGACGPR